MVTITHALRQVKDGLGTSMAGEAIRQVFVEAGHVWRNRLLDPVLTVRLFLLQILFGNVACTALRHWVDEAFTASAYCQARERLPLDGLKRLVARVTSRMHEVAENVDRWCGHRVFHIDGTSFSMPDEPALQAHFGQPGRQKKGCGYPVAHLLALCHAGSGMILDVIASPLRTHDMAGASRLHSMLKPGDILVGDRAFCSYAHLALVLLGNLHAVFRMHQRQIVDFRRGRRHRKQYAKGQRQGRPTSAYVRSLGRWDQVVRWLKPPSRPSWMTAKQYDALPESIEVRELRYIVRRPGFRPVTVTLATTLYDPERYSVEALAELYPHRWQIELNFRHLKQTLGMDTLRCKSVSGVLKEMWMFVLVYNLVRLVMLKAAERQAVPPDRISFVDALRWLCHARPRETLRELIVNPRRPNRIEPRAVKRRPKEYKRLTVSRSEARKRLKNQQHAA